MNVGFAIYAADVPRGDSYLILPRAMRIASKSRRCHIFHFSISFFHFLGISLAAGGAAPFGGWGRAPTASKGRRHSPPRAAKHSREAGEEAEVSCRALPLGTLGRRRGEAEGAGGQSIVTHQSSSTTRGWGRGKTRGRHEEAIGEDCLSSGPAEGYRLRAYLGVIRLGTNERTFEMSSMSSIRRSVFNWKIWQRANQECCLPFLEGSSPMAVVKKPPNRPTNGVDPFSSSGRFYGIQAGFHRFFYPAGFPTPNPSSGKGVVEALIENLRYKPVETAKHFAECLTPAERGALVYAMRKRNALEVSNAAASRFAANVN